MYLLQLNWHYICQQLLEKNCPGNTFINNYSPFSQRLCPFIPSPIKLALTRIPTTTSATVTCNLSIFFTSKESLKCHDQRERWIAQLQSLILLFIKQADSLLLRSYLNINQRKKKIRSSEKAKTNRKSHVSLTRKKKRKNSTTISNSDPSSIFSFFLIECRINHCTSDLSNLSLLGLGFHHGF